jgi:chromate reductase, NAD(P)H dehydrogenase (quinone)
MLMATGGAIKVLGFSGSLRAGSFNSSALRTAQELATGGLTIETFDLAPIPLYNEDVYAKGFPPPVADFRARIKAADALLICSPEYNYSTSGVLKNAIDWASRPPDQPLDGKPIALLSASPSFTGGARAQYHLRQIFVYLNPFILNRPEVMISSAHTKFDQSGKLTDDKVREQIRGLLTALKEWTERVRGN